MGRPETDRIDKMTSRAYVAPTGAIESWCRFNGTSRIAILATLLSARSAADRLNRRQGSWAFKWAIICHKRKGIDVAIDDRATAVPMVGGLRFHASERLKEEATSSYYYTTQRGAWTSTSTSDSYFPHLQYRKIEISNSSTLSISIEWEISYRCSSH